jgi:hypothetical protein
MSWHIIGEAMSLVTWWGLRDRVLRRGRRSTTVTPVGAGVPAEALASADVPETASAPDGEPIAGGGS